MWLDRVAKEASYDVNRTWKSFLLEQMNHPKSRADDWSAWEDPSFDSRDLPPHEAAHSVRKREGPEAFEPYHRELFRTHHDRDRDITRIETLTSIAENLNLNEQELRDDLENQTFREDVGAEHQEGAEEYGVFGVPTLLFDGTQPLFIKLEGGDWEGSDDLELFESIYDTAATNPHLLTLKKPTSAADRPAAPERDYP